jgi:hypothetical protein
MLAFIANKVFDCLLDQLENVEGVFSLFWMLPAHVILAAVAVVMVLMPGVTFTCLVFLD